MALNLEQLAEAVHEIALPKQHSLRLINDRLWQCHSNGVSFYTIPDLEQSVPSMSNSLKKDGKEDDGRVHMGCVYDVALWRSQNDGMRCTVIIAAENGLFHVKMLKDRGQRRIKHILADGRYTSVVVHDNHVYAGSPTENRIMVYIKDGDNWRRQDEEDIALGDNPGIINMTVSGNGLFVSRSMSNRICSFDLGNNRQSLLSDDVVQNSVYMCQAAKVEERYSVLIVDRGNDTIRVRSFSDQGRKWEDHPVNVKPGHLHCRCAIYVVSDGKTFLFVNSTVSETPTRFHVPEQAQE